MKKYLVIMALVLSAGQVLAQESKAATKVEQQASLIKTVDLTIEGMACQEGCADVIAANLLKLEGVSLAEVVFETGKAAVAYNVDVVTLDQIKSTITGTKVKTYVYTVKEVVELK